MKILQSLRQWNTKRVLNKYLIEFLWDEAETFEDVLEKFDYVSLQKMRSGNNNLRNAISFSEHASAPVASDGHLPILDKIQAELNKHPRAKVDKNSMLDMLIKKNA